MTTKQAAAWLAKQGLQVQPHTVAVWCSTGRLRADKPGRDWDITESALRDLLDTNPSGKRGYPAGVPRQAERGPKVPAVEE